MNTPKQLGFQFPAEWEKHAATWLSYPHNEVSFPGKIDSIYPSYFEFIKQITKGEHVHLNVKNEIMKTKVENQISKYGVDKSKVTIHLFPNNDGWTRDHGPAFVVNKKEKKKSIVKWQYNAWGDKYPYDLDNKIPFLIADYLKLPLFETPIIMEGGSVDFNGKGTLLTTTSCLLHENRNPSLNQAQIEQYLLDYYGVEQILWLGEGITGDDTNGHIDDLTRFVSEDTVITMVEHVKADENYKPLQENLEKLKKMRLLNGKQLNILDIPMPSPVIYEDTRLPASYANFYICNSAVIVPTFGCPEDIKAIDILSQHFKDRPVVGLDSFDIIWGFGSFHCLSQQEPAI